MRTPSNIRVVARESTGHVHEIIELCDLFNDRLKKHFVNTYLNQGLHVTIERILPLDIVTDLNYYPLPIINE